MLIIYRIKYTRANDRDVRRKEVFFFVDLYGPVDIRRIK